VGKGAFDSFRIEEAYNWRDDIMEITRRIVHETDKARLNNIAEHFKVDLSEIREFFEMKRKKMQKPQTNADAIRSMTDEELVEIFANNECGYCRIHDFCFAKGLAIDCEDAWLDWLKQEAKDDNRDH
jgi:hypothetical protein